MATPSKTQDTQIISLQSVAASTVLISSTQTVTTKFGALLQIQFGRRSATAAGAGVEFRCEASPRSSGDGFWFPLATFRTDFAAASDEAVSGTVSAGTNVITVAATAGFTARDKIFIDNGTIANSEWGRVKSIVTNTSVTIEDNLVNAQTGATIYDSAEFFTARLDLTDFVRFRLVADGSLFTQAFAVQAYWSSWDSV